MTPDAFAAAMWKLIGEPTEQPWPIDDMRRDLLFNCVQPENVEAALRMAYEAGRDELEEENSALTREIELSRRTHEKVTAEYEDEIARLRARVAELERPVSAPPSHRRAPTAAALLGYNAATVDPSEPPLAAEPEAYVCHCEQSGYPDASCPTHGVKATILLPLLDAARAEPEAGITEGPEIAVVVDAELNGHEPTPWTEGGGFA